MLVFAMYPSKIPSNVLFSFYALSAFLLSCKLNSIPFHYWTLYSQIFVLQRACRNNHLDEAIAELAVFTR